MIYNDEGEDSPPKTIVRPTDDNYDLLFKGN